MSRLPMTLPAEERMSRPRLGLRISRLRLGLMITLLAAGACTARDDGAADTAAEPAADEVALGPADGRDLSGVDLERVQVGQPAPDFTLTSLAGPPVTLSSFRGAKNVVLVFYRGHW